MNMYIRIDENNNPIEHPILEENLLTTYPDFDPNNLPEGYAKFVRVDRPVLSVYEVYDNCTYEWDGDVVKDVHNVRPMTLEEKKQRQDFEKQEFSIFKFNSWTFDEETCKFVPPHPSPTDGIYHWRESDQSWVKLDFSTYPEDGKIYRYDLETETWVEDTGVVGVTR